MSAPNRSGQLRSRQVGWVISVHGRSGLVRQVSSDQVRLGQVRSVLSGYVMPALVMTGQLSSGQGCQVRTGWSGQDRSCGSGHVRTVLFSSSHPILVSRVKSGQVRFARSGQVMTVQVSSDRSEDDSSGQGSLDTSIHVMSIDVMLGKFRSARTD